MNGRLPPLSESAMLLYIIGWLKSAHGWRNSSKPNIVVAGQPQTKTLGFVLPLNLTDGGGGAKTTPYVQGDALHFQPSKPAGKLDRLLHPHAEPFFPSPVLEKPALENPTQLNIDIQSKEKQNTDLSITQSYPITALYWGKQERTEFSHR